MTRRQRVLAKRRRGTGGHTGIEDRADVIERESEASFPASDAPGRTPISRIGSSRSPEESAPAGCEGVVVSRTTSEEVVRQGTARLDIQLKRAYEPAAAADGVRILVDRLWPRGLTKAAAAVDRWMRDLAPSTDLRRWFGHDPSRWDEFRREYARELRARGDLLEEVRSLARRGRVTLLFGARDEAHNDAVALREVLLE
jgi:uncharacterized protein YeaO (DUF488 family)